MYVENREEGVDDARGRFSRELKRKRNLEVTARTASRMKRKRRKGRIKRGLNLGGPDEEASSSRSISALIEVEPRTSESFMERLDSVYISDSAAENLDDFF